MDEVISRAGASLRIMEKLGMKRAEELECGDGHLVYVIRRADWLQSQ
jgi:RimJ/RimL family protein N-acetyltransferase